MENKNRFQPPKTVAGDYVHLTAKSLLSAIPIVGGPVAELFNAIIAPPLELRKQEWMENVANSLQELNSQGKIDINYLKDDPLFITTVLHASQAALRNHQKEKLIVLRNAVLNSALPNPPEESLRIIYLNFIDTCTVWHLKILDLIHDPMAWSKSHNIQFPNYTMGGLSNIIEAAFPELNGKREFYDIIWNDLNGRGFVSGGLHVTVSGASLHNSHSTQLGKNFLNYIKEPS